MDENKWILCEDEQPECNDEFLVTWTTSDCKRPFLAMLEYGTEEGWILAEYMKAYSDIRVVAWMQLPEPWKEGDE